MIVRGCIIALVPLILLLPWSAYALTHPLVLLTEQGLNDPAMTQPLASPLSIALLQPGGPGAIPIWASAGIVIAAVLALLRPDRRVAITWAWGIAVGALIVALALSRVSFSLPGVAGTQVPWPGMATLVLGASLIVAAALAGDGIRGTVASATFGYRQPLVAVGALAAVASMVACAIFWMPGSGDPLRRG